MSAKLIVAAALLAVTAGSAMAGSVTVQKPGTVTFSNKAAAVGNTPSKSGAVQVINNVNYTSFADVYTFSVPDAKDAFTATFTQTANAGKNIDFTGISLVGGGHTYNFTMTSANKVSEAWSLPSAVTLQKGVTYTLNVSGITTGSTTYAGSLHVAAVPEPETYAMMLAGLGLVGAIARRRKSA